MKANELRIGNLINVIGLVSVSITVDHIKSISEGDNQYAPIPLTEEWLRKFGFSEKYKSTSNRWSKWNGACGLDLHDCEDEQGQTHGVFLYDFTMEIKSVHQLQNLYFALTGEELTIK